MNAPLARYEAACRALTAAKAVDEVLALHDRAQAMAAYARIAQNRSLEIDAAEIRFRAERRLGELMAAQRDSVGLARPGRKPSPENETPAPASTEPCAYSGSVGTRFGAPEPTRPSLAEAGIGKRLADRARTYAALAPDAFEARLATRRAAIEAGRRRVTVDLLDDDDAAARRAAREVALAGKIQALPERRYGVVLDDPEWRFEVRSRETGLDRAADNHYPTSSIEAIRARSEDIAANLAAADCAWFRWVTNPFLAHGMRALEVGGFVYKTNWAWGKDRIGTGYWNRNRHEILLLAVRGEVPCPAPGTQWESLLPAPVGEHSAKPERFLEMIEAYFPHVRKIELNRRGPARPGWDAWGNEVTLEDAA